MDLVRVIKALGEHTSLKNQPRKVHPQWQNLMVKQVLWDTSQWMKKQKKKHGDNALVPGRVFYKTNWCWGDGAEKPNSRKTPLQNLAVKVKVPGQNNTETFGVRLFVQKSKRNGEFALEDISYELFWRKVRAKYTIANNSRRYTAAYLSPYRGGESIRVHDNTALQVAIEILHTKGREILKFRLVEVPKNHEWETMSDPRDDIPAEEADDDVNEYVGTDEEWEAGEDVEEEDEYDDPYYESTDTEP